MRARSLAVALLLASGVANAGQAEPYSENELDALETAAWVLVEEERETEGMARLLALARDPSVPASRQATILLDASGLAMMIADHQGDVSALCEVHAALEDIAEDAALDDRLRDAVTEHRKHTVADLDRRGERCEREAPERDPERAPIGPFLSPASPRVDPPTMEPSRGSEVHHEEPRRFLITGAVLTGVGLAALVGTGASIYAYHRDYAAMRSISAGGEAAGVTTPWMDAEIPRLHERTKLARTVGVTTAVVGGASLIAGVVLLVLDRRARRLEVHPSAAPGHAGLVLRGQF